MTAHCADCGLTQRGERPECEMLFEQVLAQHFEKPAYFGVHRLFVDTYCLQHPDHGCISFKSFAAHAAHLCWSLERGGSRAIPSEPIRRWVERNPHLQKPPLPGRQGTLTIADVVKSDAAEHAAAVGRWAEDVWSAYSELHTTVRHWVDLAFAESGKRS